MNWRGPAPVGPPVGQGPRQTGPHGADAEEDATGTDTDVERHERGPRKLCTVTWERTSCASTPAMTGGVCRPSQMLLRPAKRSSIVWVSPRPSNGIVVRVAPHWLAQMNRNIQVPCDLGWDLGRQRADVPEQPMLASAAVAGEVGPGRRDHTEIDLTAIIFPHLAINHVARRLPARSGPMASEQPAVPARAGSGIAPRRRGAACGRSARNRRVDRTPVRRKGSGPRARRTRPRFPSANGGCDETSAAAWARPWLRRRA